MITLKVKYLKGLQKLSGLINDEKASQVFFRTHFGIHTFGLKFPIDVLILDSKGRVVKQSQNLKPNRIYLWPLKYNQVIELPAGVVKKNNIEVGDQLKLNLI